MKKFTQFLIVFLVAITLTSCQKAPGGPYIIPIVGYLITAGLLVAVYFSSKSNSDQQTPVGIKDNTGNVPFYKMGRFYWACGVFVLTIIAHIAIYNDYRPWDPKKDDPYPEKPAPDGRESAEDQARKADSVYNLNK